MMKLMIVVVSSLAFLGCKENHASAQEETVPPEAKPVERPKAAGPKVESWKDQALKSVAKLTELKDAMCKCRDLDCATKVMEAQAQWTQESSSGHAPGYGDAERAELEKMLDPVLKAYTKCMTAAVTPSETAPPPKKLDDAQTKAVAALAKTVAFKDAMCKCKQADTDCVLGVMKAQQEWAAQATNAPADGSTLTADDKAELRKALDPVVADYKKCMNAALTPTR